MHHEAPSKTEVVAILERFRGRRIQVEVSTASHVDLVTVTDVTLGDPDGQELVFDRPDTGEVAGSFTLMSKCLRAWARDDAHVVHLEFEEFFVHVWDIVAVADEIRRLKSKAPEGPVPF